METQTQYRKEGEYWAIGYASKCFRLKNTKGLGYLAYLLRHPAVETHVLDLAERSFRFRGGTRHILLSTLPRPSAKPEHYAPCLVFTKLQRSS